ncbi:MAG: sulfatase [Deltaproteobacteria bacterium]|nr:sulfatase [Deltaproteobacteria bacterium]MBW2420086.1 sulfatase [Deltaproteobacteria bacterium]
MSSRQILNGWIGAVLCVLACGEPVEMQTQYVDLVTSSERASRYETQGPKMASCADENRYGWLMKPAGQVTGPVDFGVDPRIVISGCLSEGEDARAREAAGQLEVVAESLDGRTVSLRIEVGESDGWWRREIDVAALAGRPGRVRLRARIPGGTHLLIKDLYVSHKRPVPARSAEPRQVMLISLDTLRADAIAALGASYPTPALDRLVADSQVWTSHYTAAAMTKPAHASLLTGQHLWLHGSLHNKSSIRPQLETVAERFGAKGFRTAAMVSRVLWLNQDFGFARGFDEYRTVKWSLSQMIRGVSNWTSEHRGDPFFYFFHTYEAHSDVKRLPYEAPGVTTETVQERFSVENYGCRHGKCASYYLKSLNYGADPMPGEAEILRFLYARSVTHVDDELGRLFDHLRRLGIYDDMMIVVTSDHGESLLENDYVMHGQYWEESVRVPMIVKWPGGRFAGQRVEAPSSGIDVAPTLLKTYGLDVDDLPGSFLPERRAGEPVYIATGWTPEHGWSAVIADDLKWVEENGLWGYKEHFFDLAEDAGRESGANHPEEVARLKRLLADRVEIDNQALRSFDRATPAPEIPYTEEEIEHLRALGYMR